MGAGEKGDSWDHGLGWQSLSCDSSGERGLPNQTTDGDSLWLFHGAMGVSASGGGRTEEGRRKKPKFKCAVLVSQGCHNTVPQTGWRKTTEIYSLSSRGQECESKVLAALPLKPAGNPSLPPLSFCCFSGDLRVPWLAATCHHLCLCHTCRSPCVSPCLHTAVFLKGCQSYCVRGPPYPSMA